jgi:hypothetical protein
VAIPVILNIIRRENVATARPNDPVKSNHGLQMSCRPAHADPSRDRIGKALKKITDLAKMSTKPLPGCRHPSRSQRPSNAA